MHPPDEKGQNGNRENPERDADLPECKENDEGRQECSVVYKEEAVDLIHAGPVDLVVRPDESQEMCHGQCYRSRETALADFIFAEHSHLAKLAFAPVHFVSGCDGPA
jgi:hypothetical protein